MNEIKNEEKIAAVLRRIERKERTWRYGPLKFWSVSKPTAKLLKFLVLVTGVENILELGCSVGYSAIWMASALPARKGHIYTTEIFEPKIEMAKKNFADCGLGKRITLIEKDIKEVLKSWEYGKMDLIFIDANKEDYLEYYESAFPLLRKAGMMVVDNVENFKSSMGKFLDRIKKDKRIEYNFVDIENGLLLIYKK
jgi:predicted O-methyltransferase YrrM